MKKRPTKERLKELESEITEPKGIKAKSKIETDQIGNGWYFQNGEKVFHPGLGVLDVKTVQRSGLLFYVLGPVESLNFSKLMVSHDAPGNLRKLIAPHEAKGVFDFLGKDTKIPMSDERLVLPYGGMTLIYSPKVMTGSIFQIAETVRDLMRASFVRKLTKSEQDLKDEAMKMLVAELSTVLKEDESVITKRVLDAISNGKAR
jgi:RNA polymerase-interacting CarD/CdnL/TRCF family regulator